jgi:hypothetical protein
MSVDGVELVAKHKRTAASKSRSDELKVILVPRYLCKHQSVLTVDCETIVTTQMLQSSLKCNLPSQSDDFIGGQVCLTI